MDTVGLKDWTDETKRILLESGGARVEELKGCTADEVEQLEQYLGVELPSSYKAFLMVAGHGAGPFLRGTDFTYGFVFYLRDAAEELLQASEQKLPVDAVVFAMHQGYVFWYFHTGDGLADPPVRRFQEGDQRPAEVAPSFTEFLARTAQEEARVRGGP